MHILFAGGGTAGHINPALAIAGYIKEKEPDTKISYIGTARNLEARLVPAAGYDFYTIDVTGFQRKLTPKNILHNVGAVKKAIVASARARKLLKELKPDVVVGTGGYVSGPVLREAVKLGIKTAIHEQNAFPGLTTKALAGNVDRVMLAMPEAEKHMKLKKPPYNVGNPVRLELIEADRKSAREKLGLDSRPLILSFGGSLGARPINEAVAGLIKSHNNSGKYYHIHAAGKSGFESTKKLINEKCGKLSKEISLREYIEDMNICMAAADLVICRAGAITLSELCICGKASILIPSPYVAENHQYHNAMTLKNKGAACVIEEKDLCEESLVKTVEELLTNTDTVKKMGENALKNSVPDSNERIYNIIKELYSQN
ncbi:MAG: undecaprenyldiphospho-muramoylpentapeptide beta-N-acetylglucosaminyltransferase [Acutalibacteraceae bacterium]|nr:undecaprenyldiphospho-muramoylpentapeptide beta-N-acetylglucosaminyltransferase [Acutalibacteraceae bacterium]